MAKFKVGDKVVMNEEANDRYVYTKEGSWGIVTEVIYTGYYRVAFKELKAYNKKTKDKPESFDIEERYVRHLNTEDDGKTEVERKINMMFKRQPYYENKVMV